MVLPCCHKPHRRSVHRSAFESCNNIMMTRSGAILRLLFSLSTGSTTPPTGKQNVTIISPPAETAVEPLLLRAARGEAVERTPVWMMRQAGRHMKAYRDLTLLHPTFRERSETPHLSRQISLQPFYAYGVDGVILFSDILTPLPAMGVEFDISEGGKIAIDPIRTRMDFESRMKNTINLRNKACQSVGQVLRELRQEVGNKATVLGFIGLPFTLASYIVEGKTGLATNFHEVRQLMNNDPQLLHDILTTLATNIANYACFQIDSGAQVLQVFDSWAGHLDSDAFASFSFQYQKKVITLIKERYPSTPIIIYMAPGTFSKGGERLPLLAKSGADVVSVDHTVTIREARKVIPRSMGIQGNLDPKILRDGPIEEIQSHVEDILKQCQQYEGNHILNLGHGIEPDTPEDNAAFFVKYAQSFRY